MKFRKKTYLHLKYEESSSKVKILICSALFAILLFTVIVLADLPEPQTYANQQMSDTYSKYFFSRAECRYIFPEGSCIVDDKYCDLNSYDYEVIELEPHTDYCHRGTIVYNDAEENRKPQIVSKDRPEDCEFAVKEGENVQLRPKGYDPDPEIGPAGKLLWKFYAPFSNKGLWETKKGDAGTTWSKIRLSDGDLYDEREFCVEVSKSNYAPKLSGLKDVGAKEGDTVTIKPRCTDPDGDKVSIKISGFMTKSEKALGYDDSGSHKVEVTCTDPDGESSSQVATISVADVNRPPMVELPESITVDEGKSARIIARTSDPDGDKVSVTFEKPFSEEGLWKTKQGDAGEYNIKVVVSDGKKQLTKTVKVVVNKVNSAPIISPMQNLEVVEGDSIELRPRVRDKEGDKVSVSYSGWMNSAKKTTGFDDAGEYDVVITAKDSAGAKSKETIHVKVLNKNRAPVITTLK